nr:hypothetical protein [Tanacetum cinerariifolium]
NSTKVPALATRLAVRIGDNAARKGGALFSLFLLVQIPKPMPVTRSSPFRSRQKVPQRAVIRLLEPENGFLERAVSPVRLQRSGWKWLDILQPNGGTGSIKRCKRARTSGTARATDVSCYPRRSHAIRLFESKGEMRQVFKPDFGVHIRRCTAFLLEQVVRFLQAALLEPAARRSEKQLLKIALKGGQAAAREGWPGAARAGLRAPSGPPAGPGRAAPAAGRA